MIPLAWQTGFWLSLAFIGWAYAGFPALLWLRARRPAAPPLRDPDAHPTLSYVIVVHNERAVIEAKLANVEASVYPRDCLQVIVASDGSDDGTNECVREYDGDCAIELVALDRVGKNAALNAGVAKAHGEILVFSDADSLLAPDALAQLVAPFADPGVGGVAGDYRYDAGPAAGDGERSYWSVDRRWKQLEAAGGSVTSATGQIYAIRRALFEAVPDGVTDDFFVSTAVHAAGKRLWFEPRAWACGPTADSADAEFRRKVRMMSRGFASVWQRRALLDPRRTGFYALQLLTHKVLRRLVGLPLLLALASSLVLASSDVPFAAFYGAAAALQLGFHGLALLGFVTRRSALGEAKLLSLPLFFDLANLAGLLALSNFLRGRQPRGWVPHRAPSRSDARTEEAA